MQDLDVQQLFELLLENPRRFVEEERSYALLEEYFDGFPLRSLHDLLNSQDELVRREAIWITSELGVMGKDLVFDVLPFLRDQNPTIRYEALDAVAVFSSVGNFEQFVHVVRALESADSVTRKQAMLLVANANEKQISTVMTKLDDASQRDKIHYECLKKLSGDGVVYREEIRAMIDSEEAIIRNYGAIAAKRLYATDPELLELANKSGDPDIAKFAEEIIAIEALS